MTDEILIQKILAGDHHAFREIVRRYEPQVAATVYGMLGSCPEAEDVGQETFIRLFRALGTFKGKSTLGTYITRIAMNLSYNEIKKRKRRYRFFEKLPEKFGEITGLKEERSEEKSGERVQNALQKLKPEFRSVMVLRYIDGYSTNEVSDILKIPPGTVLSRQARAKKILKTILTSSS